MIFGHPFHGLVQGGQLTLPNGQTMAYPQPNGGDCMLLRVPGVPAVVRSEAEQADDAEAGFQWLDYALLSGAAPQLYGKSLGTAWGEGRQWMHATATTRTLYEVQDTSFNGGVLTINIRAHGFGDIDGVTAWSFFSPTVTGDVGTIFVRVLDAASDGSHAALLFQNDSGQISIVEMSISGSEVLSARLAFGLAACRPAGERLSMVDRSVLLISETLSPAYNPTLITTTYNLYAPGVGVLRLASSAIVSAWYEGSTLTPVIFSADVSTNHSAGGENASVTARSSEWVGPVGGQQYLQVRIEVAVGAYTRTENSTATLSLSIGGAALCQWEASWSVLVAQSAVSWTVGYNDALGGAYVIPTGSSGSVSGDSGPALAVTFGRQVGLVWASSTSSGNLHYLGFAAKNGGGDSALVTVAIGTAQHHTANPVSGAIIRNQSVPVCWV